MDALRHHPRITSARNPKIQRIRRLYQKRARQQEGCFVVESARDMRRALAAGATLEYALICEDILGEELLGSGLFDNSMTTSASALSGKCHRASAELLARAGFRQNPSGLLAVLRAPPPVDWNEEIAGLPVLLVMVGLRVPGNIGALLRSADALGVRGALLVDSALDLYNPNLIRNSTGASFQIPQIAMNGDEALAKMRAAGFSLVTAAVDGECAIDETQLPEKLALLLGEEHAGLDERWLSAADLRLRIPMNGRAVDSLNVAACGAILMYEARRQRNLRAASAP